MRLVAGPKSWADKVTPRSEWSIDTAPAAGMRVLDRTSGCVAEFDGIDWTVGKLRGEALAIGGTQVVGNQQAAIADPAGGTTVDVEARASLGSILSALRDHGLIAS